MTLRAMVLAHGDRIVEWVEIKREPESSASPKADEEEDLGDSPSRQPSPPEDWDAELDETMFCTAYLQDGQVFKVG